MKSLSIGGVTVLIGASLVACAVQPNSSSLPDTSLPGTLSGSILYRERIALDPEAVIEVELLDVSKVDAPAEVIAAQTINAEGKQVPVPFTLTYDPAQIDARNRYNVSARILVDGKLVWNTQDAHPVLTQNNPVTDVEIVVKKVPASSPGTGE